ncbi:DUF4180 domain-containing protein [Cellulomonas edaphi]|uniref:DUF4180 domain-containing protein n=1 Tax=Cellulomonas edaphi TaxID=3053468 RepID=A0ABT7SAH7_9CELL|nr:DUF4180 domain-containing protein [Cellulomons edaphi]MDM7832635.1 DUF4180 domain-containing protein [Cellulomons edaphi]
MAGKRRVSRLADEGPLVSTVADVLDLVGDAWSVEAEVIAVPVSRLHPAFFDLSSGFAGDVAQKLVNYHLVLAVVGDVSDHAARSSALTAWIAESNRGSHVWFVPDDGALDARL